MRILTFFNQISDTVKSQKEKSVVVQMRNFQQAGIQQSVVLCVPSSFPFLNMRKDAPLDSWEKQITEVADKVHFLQYFALWKSSDMEAELSRSTKKVLAFLDKEMGGSQGFEALLVHDIFPMGFIAAEMSKELKIPYLLSLHSMENIDELEEHELTQQAVQVLEHAEAIICLNDGIRLNLKKRYPQLKQVFTIHNAVSFNDYLKLERNSSKKQLQEEGIAFPQQFLFVTRGDLSEKAANLLLTGFSNTRNAQLLVVNNHQTDLTPLLASYEVEDRVAQFGEASESLEQAILAASDTFICPAWEENSEALIVQSLAAGCPVVMPYSYERKKNFPPDIALFFTEDDAEALGKTMRYVFRNTHNFPNWILRQHVKKNFSPHRVIVDIQQVFQKIFGVDIFKNA